MKRINPDVVIVGAGPAGALTAFYLAKAGVPVMLLEKSNFPRSKTCGGGLTHHALCEVPFNIEPVIHEKITWGYVGVNGGHYQPIHGTKPISYLIDRISFDAFLLQKAIEVGAICRFGQRCLSVNEVQDAVIVNTDDQAYHCRCLVGADGVHSRVAQQVGLLPNRKTTLAYEARLSRASSSPAPLIDSITFDFGVLCSGYAWIFPKLDHLNVGVFRSWPGKRAAKKHLCRFLEHHPALSSHRINNLQAHPIPLGIRNENLNSGRVLLVGDAANLADPWLGEGLFYALASARLAAQEILGFLEGSVFSLAGYTHKVHQQFVRQFSSARKLSLLVNVLPRLSVHLLQSSTTLQRLIISLLRGEKTHSQVCRDLWRWVPDRLAAKLGKHWS